MADSVEITNTAIANAQKFLESYLAASIPDGNFRDGSHLHDIVVRAFSYALALFDSEAAILRNMQSLKTLANLESGSTDDVVDNLVANWFLERKVGSKARGVITIHLSLEVEALSVLAGSIFTRLPGVEYVFTSDSRVYLRDSDMTPEYDSAGVHTGYSLDLPVEARLEGIGAEVSAGKFASWDPLSPYVTSIENRAPFGEAAGLESTFELLDRASTAISSRDFLSSGSLDTVIRSEVLQATGTTVIGAGDPEMMRDLVSGLGSGSSIHSLGFVNVYVRLPSSPGQSLSVSIPADSGTSTLTFAGRLATVDSVAVTRTGHSGATPTRVSSRAATTGRYYVLEGSSGQAGPTTDASLYAPRATTYNGDTTVLDAGTWGLSVEDPVLYASKDAVYTLDVGVATFARTVTVGYTSWAAASDVDTVLADSTRRIASSNLLAYCFTPVRVKVAMSYALYANGPGELPEDQAKSFIASYISSSDGTRNLRASDIVTAFLGEYSLYVAAVDLPITITYELHAPNGALVPFSTQDKISPVLLDQSLATGVYTSADALLHQLSSRTVCVLAVAADITLTEVVL
jgi:hypothetical protein